MSLRLNISKIKTISLLLLIPFLNGKSQESLRPKGCYFGIFVSPDYSYVYSHPDKTQLKSDKPIYARTSGFDLLFQTKNKFAFKTGLYLSLKGYKTEVVDFTKNPEGGDFKGYFKYRNWFLELPLNLEYYFSKRKVSPFINLGISADIQIYDASIGVGVDEYEGKVIKGVTNPNLTPIIQLNCGGGIDIAFKNHSRLKIFPVYRLTIFHELAVFDYNNRPYSFGLGLNYCFKLGKKPIQY